MKNPPQLAERILAMLLRREDEGAVLGDLHEEYQSRDSWWYWSEVARSIPAIIRTRLEEPMSRPAVVTLVLVTMSTLAGVGAWTIGTITTTGPMVFIPYVVMVLIAARAIAFLHIERALTRFGLLLLAFMTTTIVHYVELRLFEPVIPLTLWGHAWRLGFMLLIGMVVSSAVAAVTAPSHAARDRRTPVSLAIGLGVLGAGFLIMATWAAPRQYAIATVFLLMAVTAVLLRRERIESLRKRLVLSTSVVAVFAAIMFLFLKVAVHHRVLKAIWQGGLLIPELIALVAIVALVSSPRPLGARRAG